MIEPTRTATGRAGGPSRWLRKLRAAVRDTRVLLHEFQGSLILAFLVIAGGAALITLFYDAGPKPDFFEAVFDVLQLLAFQSPLAFPRNWALRLLFFLIPIFSALVLAESLVRFGILFFNRKNRMEAWNVSLAATQKNHVVVCGLGRVGYRIVEELLAMGESVTAIEQDRGQRFVDAARAKEIPVLVGDARTREHLLEANVAAARAIICATDVDLTNLEAALTAREVNPRIRVVVRMFDPLLAKKLEKALDMTTFSTTAISAPVFAAAATDRNVVHSFHLGETRLSIAQILVPDGSRLVARSVEEVERRHDASIVALARRSEIDFHPSPDTRIVAGDRIAVLAPMETLAEIERENAVQGAMGA